MVDFGSLSLFFGRTYCSYVEISYIPTKKYEFSPTKTEIAVKLLNGLKLLFSFLFLILHQLSISRKWDTWKNENVRLNIQFSSFFIFLIYCILMKMVHKNSINSAFHSFKGFALQLRNQLGRYSCSRSDCERKKAESIFYTILTYICRVFIWILWDQRQTLNNLPLLWDNIPGQTVIRSDPSGRWKSCVSRESNPITRKFCISPYIDLILDAWVEPRWHALTRALTPGWFHRASLPSR